MRNGLLLVLLLVSSCSLEGKKNRSILDLVFDGRSRDIPANNPLKTFSDISVRSAPADLTGFACLGVNVVGPGIIDRGQNPDLNFNFGPLMSRTNTCAYRGLVAGPLYLNGSNPINASIEVPLGQRLVQMVGITESAYCSGNNETFLAQDIPSLEPGVYEIGRAVVDLFSDKVVSIVNDYPSGGSEDRRVDCGGDDGCEQNYDSVGTGGYVVGSTKEVAQKLVITTDGVLNQIDLYLGGASIASSVTMDVCNDSAGTVGSCPGGSWQTSQGVPLSTNGWITFTFGSQPVITAGNYWIKISFGAGSLLWFENQGAGQTAAYKDTSVFDSIGVIGTQSQIAIMNDTTCVKNTSGEVRCVGMGTYGENGNGVSSTRYGLGPAIVFPSYPSPDKIVAGANHGCAIGNSGVVNCWGKNLNGQIGDGTTATRNAPVNISTGGVVDDIATGDNTTCVAISGAVKCWGINTNGAFGNGTTAPSLSPTAGTGLYASSNVTKVAVGGLHSCAIDPTTPIAYCSGLGTSGQLGQGSPVSSTSAVTAGLASNPAAIGAGASHSCAMGTSGIIQCWGSNTNGQVGDNTTTQRNSATTVVGISSATQLAVGKNHTCAIDAGVIKCWGSNTYGQLGDGTTVDKLVPTAVTLPNGDTAANVTSSSSADYTCAGSTAGRVYCWGNHNSTYGKFGLGYTATASLSPREMMRTGNLATRIRTCP